MNSPGICFSDEHCRQVRATERLFSCCRPRTVVTAWGGLLLSLARSVRLAASVKTAPLLLCAFYSVLLL